MSEATRLTRTWQWLVMAVLCAALLAAARAQAVREPAPGVLLVAAEHMADPRFSRSVVLVIEHDRTGSWGLIINKPTDIGVAEVLPSVGPSAGSPPGSSGQQLKVHFGGPVRLDHLVFLYHDDSGSDDFATGLPGVRWSDSEQTLKDRLSRDAGQVRVYAGYAGWAPGQLAFEVAHGGWRMIEGREDDVFSDQPERLWQRLTDALGGISI